MRIIPTWAQSIIINRLSINWRTTPVTVSYFQHSFYLIMTRSPKRKEVPRTCFPPFSLCILRSHFATYCNSCRLCTVSDPRQDKQPPPPLYLSLFALSKASYPTTPHVESSFEKRNLEFILFANGLMIFWHGWTGFIANLSPPWKDSSQSTDQSISSGLKWVVRNAW